MAETINDAGKGTQVRNKSSRAVAGSQGSPERFYKYRSVAGESRHWTESILLRNELFYASSRHFNDPFDCRPRFSTEATIAEERRFLKEVLKRAPWIPKGNHTKLAKGLSEEKESYEAALRDAIHHVGERLSHHVGIFCLSTKPDDILMWSHYADSHRGVCLTFAGQKGACPFPMARPVHYQSEFPVCNPLIASSEEIKRLAIYTKSDHWSYEKEWRLTSADGPGSKRFQPSLLKEVILGVSISPESEALVRKWIANRFHRTKLRRAVLKPDRYGIAIVNA